MNKKNMFGLLANYYHKNPQQPGPERTTENRLQASNITNTNLRRKTIADLPTYDVNQVDNANGATITITASDISGIHYITYILPGETMWRYSATQPQNPNSGSYSYVINVTTEGTLQLRAMDNGGNYPIVFAQYEVKFNHAPTVSAPAVTPLFGGTSTSYEYTVNYRDPDGTPPSVKGVYIDGSGPYNLTLKSGSADDGTYRYTTPTLPIGTHSYYFYFKDGGGLPAVTGVFKGPYVGANQIGINTDFNMHSADVYVRVGVGPDLISAAANAQTYECTDLPKVVWANPGDYLSWSAYSRSTNHSFIQWEFKDDSGTAFHTPIVAPSGGFPMLAGTNVYATGMWNYTPNLYTISGAVLLKSTGTPVPGGVDLILTSEQQTISLHTDDGNFSFSGIKGGVAVKVTVQAGGYDCTPSQLVFNNLKSDQPAQNIVVYSSDNLVPMTTLTTYPPSITNNSNVTFSWSGVDNVSVPANLVYQYKLDGVDTNWLTFTSATTISYTDLQNGVYTFWVRAKDEADNINQDPVNYRFVVNAQPTIVGTTRTDRSVWASRVSLAMPASAIGTSNKFVLLPEHSGTSDSDLVPVSIYRWGETSPCGANSIVATKIDIGAPDFQRDQLVETFPASTKRAIFHSS